MLLMAMTFASVVKAQTATDALLVSQKIVVWNKKKSMGKLHIEAKVNDRDTLFVMAFEISDVNALRDIRVGDEMKMEFDDGRVLRLINGRTAPLNNGRNTHFVVVGFVPLGYNTEFVQVNPVYEISKENLLQIVEGNVTGITFMMQNVPYHVDIKRNMLSDVVGELCASIKQEERTMVEGTPVVDAKSLFGEAKLRHSRFGWNKTVEVGLGVDMLYSKWDDTNYTLEMPTTLFSMDIVVGGFYLGMGMAGRKYDDSSTCTFEFKTGPVFGYGNLKSCVSIAPYAGVAFCELGDDYSTRGIDSVSKFLAGLRLAYNFKNFEISGNVSNRGVGIGIGLGM